MSPLSHPAPGSPLPLRILRRVALLLLLWLALHTLYVVVDGLNDAASNAHCILVLGNTVLPDGQPAQRTQARLDKAVQLFQDGRAPMIMVSGGTGVEGQPEGSRMADYLVAHGVPAAAIVVDDHGDNTAMTAQNCRKVALQRGWSQVIVVSQFFHLTRCKLLLRRAGIANVGSAHADYFEWRDVYSTLREFPAFYAALF